MTRTRQIAVAAALVVVVGGIFVKPAGGDSTFNMKDTWGVFLPDGTTYVPAGSLVQLIWSLDQAYHPAVAGKLDAAGYLTSGDYILFEGAGTHDGGWLGDLDGTALYDENDTGGTYLPSGYVYIRVFNIPYGTAPTVATWFVQSELVVVDNEQTNVPPDIPDSVDIAPTQGSGVMDQQVAIPEPASLALLGVGAVALMLRRRR